MTLTVCYGMLCAPIYNLVPLEYSLLADWYLTQPGVWIR